MYSGLNRESIIYQGYDESDKRICLLFDDVTRHNHVIGNLTWVIAKLYVCEGCNKGCKYDIVHICDQTCSDCMVGPPCISTGIRIPCDLCKRHFRSQTCFDSHKRKSVGNRKSASELRMCCGTCGVCSHEIYTNPTNGSGLYVKRTQKPTIFAICVRW